MYVRAYPLENKMNELKKIYMKGDVAKRENAMH